MEKSRTGNHDKAINLPGIQEFSCKATDFFLQMTNEMQIPGTIQEITAEWFSAVPPARNATTKVTRIGPAFESPKGFLSTHVRVERSDGASYFLKLNPTEPRYLDFLRRSRYDRIEALFYSVIVKGIEKFFFCPLPIPTCVYVASEHFDSDFPKSVIVFEDTSPAFVTPSPSVEWSPEQVFLAAKALAKMNALCYSLAIKASDEINEVLSNLAFDEKVYEIIEDRAASMSQVSLSLIEDGFVEFDSEVIEFLGSFASFLKTHRSKILENVQNCKFAC